MTRELDEKWPKMELNEPQNRPKNSLKYIENTFSIGDWKLHKNDLNST